jgi:hypothetical protein
MEATPGGTYRPTSSLPLVFWGALFLVFVGLSLREIQFVGLFMTAGMLCHHAARRSGDMRRAGWLLIASWALIVIALGFTIPTVVSWFS